MIKTVIRNDADFIIARCEYLTESEIECYLEDESTYLSHYYVYEDGDNILAVIGETPRGESFIGFVENNEALYYLTESYLNEEITPSIFKSSFVEDVLNSGSVSTYLKERSPLTFLVTRYDLALLDISWAYYEDTVTTLI